MDAEQLTVLLVVVSHCSLTPFVMSRHLKVALPAGALLLLCVAFLMTARGVNLMLYTHYVPGISALIVSREILCGDGTCVNTQRIIGPAIIFVQEAFISQYLAIKVYSSSFYSLSHNLLHIIAAGWMLSLVLDHAFRRFWPARLHAFRLARQVHDPSVMACLGVAMIAHQHDETPIGEFFHNTWGSMFLAMAATHLLSSLVHAVQPVDAPASVLARGLHSFCWVANGLWACLMGIWMNLWGDGGKYQGKNGSGRWTGAREVVFPAIGQDMPSAYEEGMALLAFTLWFTGAVVGGQLWQGDATPRSSSKPLRLREAAARTTFHGEEDEALTMIKPADEPPGEQV